MGVVKAVNGIILFEELESITGWLFSNSSYGMGVAGGGVTSGGKSGSCFYAYGSKVWYQTGYAEGYLYKTLNLGTGSGRKVHIFGKVNDTGSPVSTNTIFQSPNLILGAYGTVVVGWTHLHGTLPDADTGNCLVKLCHVTTGADYYTWYSPYCYADYLCVCTSDMVKLSGLFATMKMELYRASDNVLIGSYTLAVGETAGSIDVSGEGVPENMYFKIYAPGGTTLIDTTPSILMCGGDEYVWNAGHGSIKISPSSFIVYRQGAKSDALPKTATITATLLDTDGNPYPGATLYFTASRGTLSAASGVTDANGQIVLTLTATTHGLAVISVSWLGDATVPAASGACTIHFFYEAETPDTTKPFQLFIEGIKYDFVSGRYARVSDNVIGDFEVELSEWSSTITKLGLVSIYRKGILEFRGIVPTIKHRLGQAEKRLSGPHVEKLLQNRVVIFEAYNDVSPTTIIADLLTKYPCGIIAGTFAAYDGTISFFAQNETLMASITRICEVIGWQYRGQNDLTLDLAASFGSGLIPVEFVEGENILSGENDEDYGNVKNVIHALGATNVSGTSKLTSVEKNESSIKDIGLQETTLVQTTITSQTTLNTATTSKKDRSAGTDYKPVPPQDKGGYGGGGGTGTGGSTHEVPV